MKSRSLSLAALSLAAALHARAADESALRAVRIGGEADGNIAIGLHALASATNCSDTVAIGDYELADGEYERGVTSINGRQLYISRDLDAFAINPAQTNAADATPLWYLGGELHLNAPSVQAPDGDDLALLAPAAAQAFDLGDFTLFLSEKRGSDDFDGRSPAAPKRTIHGCYLAATNDSERVAVFPGTYHTPSVTANTNNLAPDLIKPYNWFLPYERRLSFKALGGASRTFIQGDGFTENEAVVPPSSTNTSAFAFGAGPQEEIRLPLQRFVKKRHSERVVSVSGRA